MNSISPSKTQHAGIRETDHSCWTGRWKTQPLCLACVQQSQMLKGFGIWSTKPKTPYHRFRGGGTQTCSGASTRKGRDTAIVKHCNSGWHWELSRRDGVQTGFPTRLNTTLNYIVRVYVCVWGGGGRGGECVG